MTGVKARSRVDAATPAGAVTARRMRATALLAAALLTTLLIAAPSGAAAAPSNASSTHAFIVADHAFAQASMRNVGLVKRRLKATKRSLLRQCGGSAEGSPQNKHSYEMSYEVAGALWSVSYGADSAAIDRLWQAVRRLRWTSRRLTSDASSYAKSLHELASLPMPHVCADIAAWKASGYGPVPDRTKRFDRRVEAIEVESVPAGLLKRFGGRADAKLLKSTQHLKRRLLDFETVVGGNIWYSTLERLDLYN